MSILSTAREAAYRFYQAHFQNWVNTNWPRIEPYYKTAKSVIIHGFVVFVIASTCLYISAFLFGALYFYNMPTIYHTFDLNFQYNRHCIEQHRSYLRNGREGSSIYQHTTCYPTATVDLGSPSDAKYLQPDQAYRMFVKLTLPESESNLRIGMFMVSMKCGNLYSTKATSLRYKPSIIRLASTILYWPLLLFDLMDAQQTLNVPLFEEARLKTISKKDIEICQHGRNNRYHENQYDYDGNYLREQQRPFTEQKCDHWIAKVTVDYPDIHIYSAQLQVTATFSGLQYLLFQWPVFSFLVGTAIFFVPVLAWILVLFYLLLFKPHIWSNNSENGNQENELLHRRRRRNRAPPEQGLAEVTLVPGEHDADAAASSSSSSSSSIEMIGPPASVDVSSSLRPSEAAGDGQESDSSEVNDENVMPEETSLRRRL